MPLRVESFEMLCVALGIGILAGIIALARRPALPRASLAFIATGLALLAFAGAGTQWRRGGRQEVAVMVDLSASTRGAVYRDRSVLQWRIAQLLGDTPFHIILFADGNQPDNGANVLRDIPSERTTFTPAPAAAILLFSDARFEVPETSPPTYIVIDPILEHPLDAAVKKLELRSNELVAYVAVIGPMGGVLTFQGTATKKRAFVAIGSSTIAARLQEGAASAAAQFSPADQWPENDAAWIRVLPPLVAERWWVGVSPPSGNWRAIDAKALPLESPDYLAPAVIVLNNIPARDLSIARQQRLQQFVRDLGGSLVILGGDRAFAAGDYTGSVIESLSPLASTPPLPVMQWVVLVDGSGSMNESTSEGTRWQVATAAVAKLLPHLPPEDLATIGSFAESITWWTAGKSVRETAGLPLPPGAVSPRGPTNLQQALHQIAGAGESKLPRQLLVVTDADAKIEKPAALAEEMKAKNIHLHVMAIGNGSGLSALKLIVEATGGTLTSPADAKSWSAGLQELGRAAMANLVETTPLAIRFHPPLNVPGREVTPWNRTWLKSSATSLANGRADAPQTPVAKWNVGTGQVIAAAFSATPAEAEALAAAIARPPRDPRIRVTWDAGSQLRASIDAVDGQIYLNGLALTLELRAEDAPISSQFIPQTGPGRYELAVPAPRSPVFATTRQGGRLIDQIAVAGRYPPEFDAIGNDHDAMHALAQRTGGAVIDTTQTKPIDFHWPRRDVPLTSALAGCGALLLAVGSIWWRLN